MTIEWSRWRGAVLSLALLAGGCTPPRAPAPAEPRPVPPVVVTPPSVIQSRPTFAIIPLPTSLEAGGADAFVVDSTVAVTVDVRATAETKAVAAILVQLLTPTAIPAVRETAGEARSASRDIRLVIDAGDPSLGAEGYDLTVTRDLVTVRAAQPAGLFHGVQTIRQLLPVAVEHPAALRRGLRLPAVHITDVPRFEWRGAMLDVSRHFLRPDAVRRFIDAMALYKLNRLHLHLADDQGWRIEILSHPELARIGGSTQVGGQAGGYYTQREYAALVAYAQARYITIVPEIDLPGHTNAALASLPWLNCDGKARPLYTGISVGFSAVCVDRDSTYGFIDDVVREISALTTGPYFHVGGDEVQRLTTAQYRGFIERVQGIVSRHGKRMIGWGEIAPAALVPGTIVQHWKRDSSAVHAARGGSVILSPATRVYLDMKYDAATDLGLRWAALIDVRDAYDWDPGTFLPGVPGASILGVEAPLWAETLVTETDYQAMAFPRLIAVAEAGWSAASARDWESFRTRLGVHGARLRAIGVNFFRSGQVEWVP